MITAAAEPVGTAASLVLTLAFQALWAWQAIRRGDDGSSNGASGEVLIIAFLTGILVHLYTNRIVLGRLVRARMGGRARAVSRLA